MVQDVSKKRRDEDDCILDEDRNAIIKQMGKVGVFFS